MIAVVPSSVAQIDPAQEGAGLIDYHDFFVVSPKKDPHFCMIRMAHDFDVVITVF